MTAAANLRAKLSRFGTGGELRRRLQHTTPETQELTS